MGHQGDSDHLSPSRSRRLRWGTSQPQIQKQGEKSSSSKLPTPAIQATIQPEVGNGTEDMFAADAQTEATAAGVDKLGAQSHKHNCDCCKYDNHQGNVPRRICYEIGDDAEQCGQAHASKEPPEASGFFGTLVILVHAT